MSARIETHDACCRIPTKPCPCPVCGNPGRKVGPLTLDHHVPGPLRKEIGDDATFCLNPVCEVVYCNPGGKMVRVGQTRLPVTIKDRGDDVLVCYCLEHRRGALRHDLEVKGSTDIPNRIRQGIKESRCDCERKNPQGACCLKNVATAIEAIREELAKE